MRIVWPFIIAIILLGSLPIAQAEQPHTIYLPLVAAAPAPSTPTPSSSIQITLPFTVLDADEPGAVYKDGWWYFTGYRVDSGSLNGGWVLRWRPGEQLAEEVVQYSTEDLASPRSLEPLGRYSPSRGSLVVGPDGTLTHWSYPSTTGRTRTLKIDVVVR